MTVIALAGRKASGKSTIARWLVEERGYTELSLAKPLKELALLFFPRTLTAKALWGPSEARDVLFTEDQQRNAAQEISSAIMNVRHDADTREIIEGIFQGAPKRVTAREAADALPRAFEPYQEGLASPRSILQHLGTEWGRKLWDEVWLNAVRRTIENAPGKSFVIPDTRFVNEAGYLKQRLSASVFWLDAETRLGPNRDRHASEPRAEDFRALCAGSLDTNGPMEALPTLLSGIFS